MVTTTWNSLSNNRTGVLGPFLHVRTNFVPPLVPQQYIYTIFVFSLPFGVPHEATCYFTKITTCCVVRNHDAEELVIFWMKVLEMMASDWGTLEYQP